MDFAVFLCSPVYFFISVSPATDVTNIFHNTFVVFLGTKINQNNTSKCTQSVGMRGATNESVRIGVDSDID